MKIKPFERIKAGDIFRDIDGNILMRIPKAYADNEARSVINCVVLVSNKVDLLRSELLVKSRDVYCEQLDEREISAINIETVQDEDNISEVV